VAEAAHAAFDVDAIMMAVRGNAGNVEIATASGRTDGASRWRTRGDALSFWADVRPGHPVLLTDAETQLDRARDGDRWLTRGLEPRLVHDLVRAEVVRGAVEHDTLVAHHFAAP
jgi:hypothetical protein